MQICNAESQNRYRSHGSLEIIREGQVEPNSAHGLCGHLGLSRPKEEIAVMCAFDRICAVAAGWLQQMVQKEREAQLNKTKEGLVHWF